LHDHDVDELLSILPDWLRQKVITPPPPGHRYHWIYGISLSLYRQNFTPEMVLPLIERFMTRSENSRGEFRLQVERAYAAFLQVGTASTFRPKIGPPQTASAEQQALMADWLQKGRGLAALCRSSPLFAPHRLPTRVVLEALFPGDPIICAGLRVSQTRVAFLKTFSDSFLSQCSFVTGSVFKEPGFFRHESNVLSHLFYVVELDILPGGDGPWAALQDSRARTRGLAPLATVKDIGCALLAHLREDRSYPLKLADYSGGKSVHGWFNKAQLGPRASEFLSYVQSWGADPRIICPEQWWRMPNGCRHDDHRHITGPQPVLFADL
jgi:hypothetical protein